MLSFLAMIWDPERADSVAAAGDSLARLKDRSIPPPIIQLADGFTLTDLSHPDTAHLFPLQTEDPAQSGVVFGSLFRQSPTLDPSGPVTQIDISSAEQILQSRGERLLTDFWGSYVAFLNYPDCVCILPDPAGSMPCYYTQVSGVWFVFSNLEKCPFPDYSGFSINWAFVSRILAYDKILTGETGIIEVQELLAGQSLTLSRNGSLSVTQAWDPRDASRDVLHLTDADAARYLSDTVRYVVTSRASAFGDIAVSLSGGLDSSIVLACLGEGSFSGKLFAVHYALGSGDGPEAGYAALAAGHAGCELVCVDVPPAAKFPARGEFPATARPFRQFLAPDLPAFLDEAPSSVPGAWFTGQGGDHLFLAATGPLGFADYLRRHGWNARVGKILLETARLSGLSVWRVLGQALNPPTNELSAMAQGFRERATRINQRQQDSLTPASGLPDWATCRADLPPAKFDQVSTLPHLFQLRECLDSQGSRLPVHPLISQPLIELCLRLPAYQLTAGGISRGLVRQAFTGAVPDRVRLRISKGFASRFYAERVTAHRDQIVGTLLDGELAERKLIAREDIEAIIRQDHYLWDKSGSMLMVYYGIEEWLQTWKRLGAQGF